MAFNNLYYKRTAGTAKACFVCYKPTTTVLATSGTVDFLYTCLGHLSDSAFATLVDEEKSAVSAEEIARVKLEWEEKQRLKRAEKEKEKDSGTKNTEQQTSEKSKKETPPTSPSATPPTPAAHERYILHRHFFTMRQAEHRRRKQAMQAKELSPRLPSAPRGI